VFKGFDFWQKKKKGILGLRRGEGTSRKTRLDGGKPLEVFYIGKKRAKSIRQKGREGPGTNRGRKESLCFQSEKDLIIPPSQKNRNRIHLARKGGTAPYACKESIPADHKGKRENLH